MTQSQHHSNRRWLPSFAAAAFLAVAVLAWCSWPSKIELSPATYDIAMALYRACNQRDQGSLQQVQVKIRELRDTADTESTSLDRLQSIVDEANDNHWKSAAQLVHQLLQEQASEV